MVLHTHYGLKKGNVLLERRSERAVAASCEVLVSLSLVETSHSFGTGGGAAAEGNRREESPPILPEKSMSWRFLVEARNVDVEKRAFSQKHGESLC